MSGSVSDIPLVPSDTGCQLAAKCLTCPLPVCKEDLDAWEVKLAKMRARSLARVAEIRRLGLTVSEAAAKYGVSRRAVYRWRALAEGAQ